MTNRMFYILDVFTEEKYQGNQLAVIRDARGLSTEEMQRIAKEMNYSETTFISSDEVSQGGYDVRIFTPEVEVPFAGHPTLGTAYTIQNRIIEKEVEKVVLNLKIGQITVTFQYTDGAASELWMRQRPPEFGVTLEPGPIAEVLNIEMGDIDENFPVMEVSTGIPFIIVPLKTLDAVKRCSLDEAKFAELIKTTDIKAFMLFAPEPENDENDIHARVFAHYYGVPEDPATGSANGCLAGYLVKTKYFGEAKCDCRVEQGYEIGRRSLLMLKAEKKGMEIVVNVGGKVILVAEGKLV
jgi:trans-2,3-dihydro-3-hydroxyanthranilate isomerase